MRDLKMQPEAFVYRFFDFDGALLYVGVTADIRQRWTEHKSSKPWWAEVIGWTVTPYETRAEAELVERLAILCERPTHNKTLGDHAHFKSGYPVYQARIDYCEQDDPIRFFHMIGDLR